MQRITDDDLKRWLGSRSPGTLPSDYTIACMQELLTLRQAMRKWHTDGQTWEDAEQMIAAAGSEHPEPVALKATEHTSYGNRHDVL